MRHVRATFALLVLAVTACDALVGVGPIVVADGGFDVTHVRDGGADARPDHALHVDAAKPDVGSDVGVPHDAGTDAIVDAVADVGCPSNDGCGADCYLCSAFVAGYACINGQRCGCNSSADCPYGDGGALIACVAALQQCCYPSGYICEGGLICCSSVCVNGVCQ
jgi:hypothetical protein